MFGNPAGNGPANEARAGSILNRSIPSLRARTAPSHSPAQSDNGTYKRKAWFSGHPTQTPTGLYAGDWLSDVSGRR
jgi:hypothetical protein